MLSGRRITDAVARKYFSCTRLADRIYTLKNENWPVKTRTIEVKNKFGEICRVSEYWLEPDAKIKKDMIEKCKTARSLYPEDHIEVEKINEQINALME